MIGRPPRGGQSPSCLFNREFASEHGSREPISKDSSSIILHDNTECDHDELYA